METGAKASQRDLKVALGALALARNGSAEQAVGEATLPRDLGPEATQAWMAVQAHWPAQGKE